MSSTAGFRFQFRASEEDVAAVAAALNELPKNIRGKVARKGLRKWGERVKTAVRQKAHPRAVRTKRQLAVKVKTYRRAIIWAGVGVRSKGNPPDWRDDPSNRSHLFDGGWRPWPKGTKSSQARTAKAQKPKRAGNWKPNYAAQFPPGMVGNRGWRKGLKKRFGGLIGRLEYISMPGRSMMIIARQFIVWAVEDALKETRRG